MDSTTSFVMALVAVVVSGFSAIASFIAIGQAALYQPRPFFQVTIAQIRQVPSFEVVLTNLGNSPAQDVIMSIRNEKLKAPEMLVYGMEMRPSAVHQFGVSLVTGSSVEEMDPVTLEMFPEGRPSRALNTVVTVKWRQAPMLGRVRQKRWRVVSYLDGSVELRNGREQGWITSFIAGALSGFTDGITQVLGGIRRVL